MAPKSPDPVLHWLLEGDPAIRWQTMRDLLDAPPRSVERERAKVAREGWGARLLALQDEAGTWASGLYSPKWTSTHYTLMLLRDLGLPTRNRQARRGCRVLLDGGIQPDGGVNYGKWAQWTRRSETCVTGMVLSLLSYFEISDDRLESLVDHLLEQQMDDGGWNCRKPRGATHSSFNTTISVLEGLRHYELHRERTLSLPHRPALMGSKDAQSRSKRRILSLSKDAQRAGREFLLRHRLFRSHRTGNIVATIFTRFSFPPRWHYDILRALDHFRDVNAPRDPRLADAMDIVYRTRCADGRWTLQNTYRGKTYFELEHVGEPSRWNTLRALRVLRWWEMKNP